MVSLEDLKYDYRQTQELHLICGMKQTVEILHV